jgi:DNA-binding response OmpR family regulator
VEAANGTEALRAVGGDRFDVILVDVMMPGMTGFEVAEQLQETAASGVPIVFLSARADKKDIARGLSLGATEYVTKPFDPGELVDRLQAILRRGPSDGASE